jgi:hypothetical protein
LKKYAGLLVTEAPLVSGVGYFISYGLDIGMLNTEIIRNINLFLILEKDDDMYHLKKDDIDLETSVEIADGIYWIGFYDEQAGLHCNPYLIVDNDEAIVIDGGSRPDFATVMMKILQTGITPNQIVALLYQHYDPDLCGSIPNFEDIIKRNDLKILSDSENLMFIRHYNVYPPLLGGHSLTSHQ